jgi:hypothetical protein
VKRKSGLCLLPKAATQVLVWLFPLVLFRSLEAFAQCSGCPNASFGPAAQSYELPGTPVAYVAADFNGDGILDLAAAVNVSTISVLLGNGRGQFGPPIQSTISGAYYLQSLAAGDFDGDGKIDLVVSDGSQTLYLLRGTGLGTFLPAVSIPVGRPATRLVSGDFNGDGLMDLAAAEPSGNYVAIYFADGAGGFEPGITLPAGPSASLMQVADFNGDGLDDLLVANYGGNSVTLIRGVRIGPFAPGVDIDVRSPPVAIAVGDFNLDGKMDFMVATGGYTDLFLGGGDGSFPVTRNVHHLSSLGLVVGDFNGDGIPDAVSVVPFLGGAPTLFFWFGDGSGAFPSYMTGAIGLPVSLAADLNRDGVSDLIGMGTSGLVVSLSSGGSVTSAPQTLLTDYSPAAIVAADFNGDGRPDVVVAGAYSFSVFLSKPSGGFDPKVSFPISGGSVTALAAADVNGDGKMDLIATKSGGTVTVYLGSGTGSFNGGVDFPVGSFPTAVGVADLDGDGKLDLVVANQSSNSVSFLKGRGDGSFAAAVQYAAGAGPNSLALADLNGDGKLDVVTANGNADNVSVLFGNGAGGFSAVSVVTIGPRPSAVVAGDLTGDGKADIAAITGQYPFRSVTVLRGDGAGGFASPSSRPVALTAAALAVADFNDDGALDIAVSGASADGVGFLMSDGLGGFLPMSTFYVGGSPAGLSVADFNLDGKSDVAVLSSNSATAVILLDTGCTIRHLGVRTDASSCNTPAAALTTQPIVAVHDDGDNVVACGTSTVTASILPGSGTAGAALGGTKQVSAIAGVAGFTNLSIDLPGLGYALQFVHPSAGVTQSRPFSQGVAPIIAGPPALCAGHTGVYDAGAGYDSHRWTLDSNPVGRARTISLAALSTGSHLLSLQVVSQGCTATALLTVSVSVPASASIAAPPAVCPYSGANSASVPDAGPGATYIWSLTNGVITAGAGTRAVSFRAGPSGVVAISVTVTNPQGCAATGAKTVAIDPTLPCPPPVGFFTVTPCRVLDTREPNGPWGGPALFAGGDRTFVFAGRCGIPPSALAVSANVVVTQPTTGPGFLTGYPAVTELPLFSTINYGAGQTRANNAVLSLGAAGDLAIHCGQATGTAHVIVDVNGYFQ